MMNATIQELEAKLEHAKLENNHSNFAVAEELANEVLNSVAGDSLLALEALYSLAGTSFFKGEYDEALNKAQNCYIQSEKQGNFKLTAKTLTVIGNVNLRQGKPNLAIENYREGAELYRKVSDEIGMAIMNSNIAIAYQRLGQYSIALEYNNLALQIFDRLDQKADSARVLDSIGNTYRDLGDYQTALTYLLKSLSIAEEIEFSQLANHSLMNIGNVYASNGDYQKALEFYQKVLEIDKEIGAKHNIASVLGNIGNIYLELSNNELALEYFREAVKLTMEIGEKPATALFSVNIGKIYHDLGSFDLALQTFETALRTHQQIDSKLGIGYTLCSIADIYRDTSYSDYNLNRAESLFLEANKCYEELGIKKELYASHRGLFEVYEDMCDYAKALHHHKEYHRIEKEVFNEESDKRLKNIQIIHDVEKTKKESEILKLENDKMKTEYELQNKHLTTLTMALVQQNEFLQSLRNELLRLAGNVDSHIQSPLKDIARRLKKQSQAQEEWSAFEEQFQLIHADFIHRLSDKFPTLSPTELKVCALLRIGLSSKEISSLFCVTLRCVETHRYRIRKKMELSQEENLISILGKI